MKTTKKIYFGCLPTPALCLHHVFHVGPSKTTSVQQMSYRGCGVGAGQCPFAHLASWHVSRFTGVFPAAFGLLNLLVPFQTFFLCFPMEEALAVFHSLGIPTEQE